ncbi:MAG: MBL fold metallo-hydrolase [Deltaproteobacteria bacterium]|nr:MBL fold metallo-hydrolase [Deltaproteobacteria bacterium]
MITITMLFNNVAQDQHLLTGWGMACLIEGRDKTILFDTGSDGRILLSNMKKLEKEPSQVDAVVLSHAHGDHTGGLGALLGENGDMELYVPQSFPEQFKTQAVKLGLRLTTVHDSVGIADGVYSTGEAGVGIKEQALLVQTLDGLVVITGCAHPGIVEMVTKAKQTCSDEVYLVLGGFHLVGHTQHEVEAVMNELRALGVKKIAPSHCTGDGPMRIFHETWQEDFIFFGCGATISLDPPG